MAPASIDVHTFAAQQFAVTLVEFVVSPLHDLRVTPFGVTVDCNLDHSIACRHSGIESNSTGIGTDRKVLVRENSIAVFAAFAFRSAARSG